MAVKINRGMICKTKVSYTDHEEAQEIARMYGQKTYECEVCGQFHNATVHKKKRPYNRNEDWEKKVKSRFCFSARKFDSQSAAAQSARDRNMKPSVYKCPVCDGYHIKP